MTSLASISALRQLLAALARVRGDKTVILISGGWPLDEREEHLAHVAPSRRSGGGARDAVLGLRADVAFSADRRMMTSTPLADNYLHSGPLETLAAHDRRQDRIRAEVGAEAVFERLGRELAGYYRIGIEKDPSDGPTARAGA